MPTPVFDATNEIPDLQGRIILITGGTAGLGRETALSYAAHGPAHIYFTGRSQRSADKLIEEVSSKFPNTPITFVQCDLASLDSVQNAAKQLLSKIDRLDIFNANAGVMALPPGQTKDGYEIQFGTNHVGHALLIKHFLPIMESTAKKQGDARLVINTSLGYTQHPTGGILFDKVKTPQADISFIAGEWIRYGQSKLANLLYTRALAKHHPSVTSVVIHPGVSATGLVDSLTLMQRLLVYVTNPLSMLTPEQCAWNQQWAATSEQAKSGVYYEPVGIEGKLLRESGNDELAEKLWDWTQKELEGYSL